MSYNCIATIVVYLLFLPPLFYCPVVLTTDADAPVIDYVVDDRTPPTVELPGKQSHFPSLSYRLLVYIYLLH